MKDIDRPNVILLVLDAVRADHLSCYGYERETSPRLDRLAENGLKFENCYGNSFCSVPSHSSLFTGKLPSEHKMFQYSDPFFEQENKLVTLMKDNGYYTYGNSNNIYINGRFGFDRDFDDFEHQMWASSIGDEKSKEILGKIQNKNWSSQKEKYIAAIKSSFKRPQALLKMASLKFERKWGRKYGIVDQGTKKSMRKIESKLDEKKPLFAFTNLMEAHAPYMVPLTFKRKYSSQRTPKEGITNAEGAPSEEELQERINLYDDCIRYLDKKIGQLVAKVEEKHPNTVFIITSDHGELFFDNDLDFEDEKQGHTVSSSDELAKVPFIIYGNFDENLFDEKKTISLRETIDIVDSIISNNQFESKNYAIQENIWKKGACSKMITDNSNKTVITEEEVYKMGDKDKCSELEDILKEETPSISKCKGFVKEQNMANELDV